MIGGGKVTDELGHLILDEEGAVMESSGELQNNEIIGSVIMNIIHASKSQLWPSDGNESCKKISINYSDHAYIVCRSNKRIVIMKRRIISLEPLKV